MTSSSKQSQFVRRVNCQIVDVTYKSHLCVNRNFFGYGVAVVMHLLMKQALIFWLLTGWLQSSI